MFKEIRNFYNKIKVDKYSEDNGIGEATNIITPKKIKSISFILIALTSFFYCYR
ncbi:hypothetical protein KKH26_01430 [Patescibacteria group bacterium]|nr:hypothetical protein [Patescibacteria group bacterium]